MPIRNLTPPKTIKLSPPRDSSPELIAQLQKEITFADFIYALTTVPEAWSKTAKGLRASFAIGKAVDDSTGGAIPLAEEDWQLLSDTAEDPGTRGYGIPPWIMKQCIPYLDAIRDATEKTSKTSKK